MVVKLRKINYNYNYISVFYILSKYLLDSLDIRRVYF